MVVFALQQFDRGVAVRPWMTVEAKMVKATSAQSGPSSMNSRCVDAYPR